MSDIEGKEVANLIENTMNFANFVRGGRTYDRKD